MSKDSRGKVSISVTERCDVLDQRFRWEVLAGLRDRLREELERLVTVVDVADEQVVEKAVSTEAGKVEAEKEAGWKEVERAAATEAERAVSTEAGKVEAERVEWKGAERADLKEAERAVSTEAEKAVSTEAGKVEAERWRQRGWF